MASGCGDCVRDTSLRATLAMYSKGLSWRLCRMPSPWCLLVGLGGHCPSVGWELAPVRSPSLVVAWVPPGAGSKSRSRCCRGELDLSWAKFDGAHGGPSPSWDEDMERDRLSCPSSGLESSPVVGSFGSPGARSCGMVPMLPPVSGPWSPLVSPLARFWGLLTSIGGCSNEGG